MEKLRDCYHYLISKIYPARVNEPANIEMLKELEKAWFILENAKEKEESYLLSYRNAFFLLKKNVSNTIKDGFSVIKSQLDELGSIELNSLIEKLDKPLYDINELTEILFLSNMIFSCYDCTIQNQYPLE